MSNFLDSLKQRFEIGDVHISDRVLSIFKEDLAGVTDLLERHRIGEWGDLTPSDKKVNEYSVDHGGVLLSAYNVSGYKVFIATDADRHHTWIFIKNDIGRINENGSKGLGSRITAKIN
jgi:hypothetical protein